MSNEQTSPLEEYLRKIPAVEDFISSGFLDDGNWWIKFSIDIDHPQAWNTVQQLGHVLNYLSLDERLPTWFFPVSPPPYMNGAARDFLSWVIESTDLSFSPTLCRDWLKGRLPRPVEDLSMWPDPDE